MSKRDSDYIQLSFRDLLVFYPQVGSRLRRDLGPLFNTFLCDPSYLVRLSNDGRVEIGYTEDAWVVG